MTRPKHVTVELTYGQARSLQKLLGDMETSFTLFGGVNDRAAVRTRGLRGRVNAAIKRAKDGAVHVAWQDAVVAQLVPEQRREFRTERDVKLGLK